MASTGMTPAEMEAIRNEALNDLKDRASNIKRGKSTLNLGAKKSRS